MNPFNSDKLSVEQLDSDCLCYMSIERKPVKSSRIFLGNMHERGVGLLHDHFRTTEDYFRNVRYDPDLIMMLKSRYSGDRRAFFDTGPGARNFKERIDLYDFKSYDEAYHQLMKELCDLAVEAIKLVLPEKDDIENIYITGGFCKNPIFLNLLAVSFPSKKVYTSIINNATALGAALVMLRSLGNSDPVLNLGLTEYHP
jgi:hypothetical protein